jgi:hypothetical protein
MTALVLGLLIFFGGSIGVRQPLPGAMKNVESASN